MMEEGFSSLEDTVTESAMESMIDSLIAADGSTEKYQDKVITEGFSQQEVVDLDETLTPKIRGFSQEERVALDGLMHAPPLLVFSINEIVLMLHCFEFSIDFNSLFDRSDRLVLALYTNEFIIAGSSKQFMMWCEKILTNEDCMKDKGGWQVVDAVFLVEKVFTLKILKRAQSTEGSNDLDSCFFKFIDGQLFDQAPRKGEIPDTEKVSCVWQRTLSSVRGSVGLLAPQNVSSRAPLMAAASRENLGTCREGTVAGTPAEFLYNDMYNNLDDNSSSTLSFRSSIQQ
jgi:hypothetical protein